uniref:Ectonucleotide pyrophosphatase/phosphodiesterase 7, tandem duplicate 2 n=1 Tax=Cyprinus carpio TaxID=7962 RepID=A0A8C1G193_CYPCA
MLDQEQPSDQPEKSKIVTSTVVMEYLSCYWYIENHGTSQKALAHLLYSISHPNMFYVHTDETYGPDSPKQQTAEKDGLGDHLNIIITADHGMSTVFKAEDVKEIILTDIPGFSLKDLKFHMVNYGPSGLLLPKEGMIEKVYPNLHVYKKEYMPARLHYSKHPCILPTVLYADPGYVINGFYVFQTYKGQHSYDNEDMDMKLLFRAVEPDFHRNLLVGPFESIHVYPLMCHLLEIKPEINDGLLDNTRHMLISNGEPCDSGGESGGI